MKTTTVAVLLRGVCDTFKSRNPGRIFAIAVVWLSAFTALIFGCFLWLLHTEPDPESESGQAQKGNDRETFAERNTGAGEKEACRKGGGIAHTHAEKESEREDQEVSQNHRKEISDSHSEEKTSEDFADAFRLA